MRSKTYKFTLPIFFLLFIVIFTIFSRVRLLNVPLERDEGEYAYIGRLILEGTPPYSEAYNMKFPGIYFIYAGILWLFGETHTAIHFCLLIVNVLSILLLFIFVRSVFDEWIAAAAAGAFALLSMSYHVLGFWANAEHFVIPFVLGAHILLFSGLRKSRKDYICYSAVLFSCAALVKQHGAFFGIFGFIILVVSLWQEKSLNKRFFWKYVLAFLGGAIIPLILCFFYLLYAGVFQKFYLWTFAYAKEYSSLIQTEDISYYFFSSFLPLWRYSMLIWIIAGAGFIALFFPPYHSQSRIHILGLTAGSIIALSIGFYFRSHYFVLVLPVVSLLFGVGIRCIYRIFSTASSPLLRYIPPIFIVTISFLSTLAADWDVLYQFSPEKVTRIIYGSCPFPYSAAIAEIIKGKTSKEDRIAIIGNEPEFLFYSQRRSATSYIYFFSLVEEQPFAEQFCIEMIHQVESAKPKLLVYVHTLEYNGKTKGQVAVDKWFSDYTMLHYTPIARFEYMFSDTLRITDTIQIQKTPKYMFWTTIYEKRNN